MKKIVTIFTIVCMLATMSLVAFAAETTVTSINAGGNTINLNLLTDFADVIPAEGLSKVVTQYDGTTQIADTTLGKAFEITTGPNWVNSAAYASKYILDDGATWGDYTAAYRSALTGTPTAFALRVKGGANVIGLSFEPQAMVDGSGSAVQLTTIKNGSGVILVYADGTIAPAEFYDTPWNRNLIKIPANFDGYVIIPEDHLATAFDKATTDVGTITDFWALTFFAQAVDGSGDVLTIYDVYWIDEEVPSVPSWIKSIVAGENGTATITLNPATIPTDSSWTEIAIFTEPQTSISSYITREPGTFAFCPASGNMTATIGPDGEFVFPGFEEGQTYYVYIARIIGNSWWNYQTTPYVFTYNAPTVPEETIVPEETETIIPEESEAATEAPSTIPSDDPNNGGDISLVLYAVTALTAGGAIVAIKRRKA